MSNSNPWKYVEIDEGELKTNPYLNPPARATPTPATPPAPSTDTAAPVIVSNLSDFLVLQNLNCVDAAGNIFESYPELRVKKDIFRDGTRQKINFTPYNAAAHCEKNGLFLPSFALTCNIVAALYKNKTNPETASLLQQYKDHGAGHGWQAQNTIINWGTGQIIHYPRDGDFPAHGGTNNINQSQAHKKLAFDRSGFGDTTLEEALKRPNFNKYIRNLTGLANPADLVEIGKYFGKTARVWVSSSNETRAAWFGCLSNNFNLYGNNNLNYNGAARGVRRGAP